MSSENFSPHFNPHFNNEHVEHIHLLSSKKAGWNKLDLVYEVEPAGETLETVAVSNTLVVCLGDFQASFKVEGKWHHEQYTPGDIAIFAAGEIFPRVKINQEVHLIDLFLSADTLTNASEEIIPSKVQLRSHFKLHDPLIQNMALALKTQLEVAGEDSKLYADSMATALGVHLLQRYAVKHIAIKEYKRGLPPYQLKLIVEYIQEHLDKSLTLTELASLIQMSPHYFASLFKQSTGLPPHKYITKSRVEKTKILLRQREFPIAFICHEVGFKNQSHLTRVFKQHFKITPKAYRDLF